MPRKDRVSTVFSLIAVLALAGCMPATEQARAEVRNDDALEDGDSNAEENKLDTITLGAGCFWCIEAVLLRVEGIESVVSGYMGGAWPDPTYEQVCTGRSGHAEVVQVEYDPDVISTDELLDLFWQLHDPTTLNRQGADVGTQYRSVIFYDGAQQREIAEASRDKWNKSGKFERPIVTEISPVSTFYKAEAYHQDYFARNPRNPYCRALIPPKLKKLGLRRAKPKSVRDAKKK